MDEKSPSCMRCRYQHFQKLAGPDGKLLLGQRIAICRRFPPSPVFVIQGTTGTILAQFPPVTADHWCYFFEPRKPDPDAALEADDVPNLLTKP